MRLTNALKNNLLRGRVIQGIDNNVHGIENNVHGFGAGMFKREWQEKIKLKKKKKEG